MIPHTPALRRLLRAAAPPGAAVRRLMVLGAEPEALLALPTCEPVLDPGCRLEDLGSREADAPVWSEALEQVLSRQPEGRPGEPPLGRETRRAPAQSAPISAETPAYSPREPLVPEPEPGPRFPRAEAGPADEAPVAPAATRGRPFPASADPAGRLLAELLGRHGLGEPGNALQGQPWDLRPRAQVPAAHGDGRNGAFAAFLRPQEPPGALPRLGRHPAGSPRRGRSDFGPPELDASVVADTPMGGSFRMNAPSPPQTADSGGRCSGGDSPPQRLPEALPSPPVAGPAGPREDTRFLAEPSAAPRVGPGSAWRRAEHQLGQVLARVERRPDGSVPSSEPRSRQRQVPNPAEDFPAAVHAFTHPAAETGTAPAEGGACGPGAAGLAGLAALAVFATPAPAPRPPTPPSEGRLPENLPAELARILRREALRHGIDLSGQGR